LEILLFIHRVLEEDQRAPRKQRHTAQRIYERLCEQMPEHVVSARSVRRAVQEWKILGSRVLYSLRNAESIKRLMESVGVT